VFNNPLSGTDPSGYAGCEAGAEKCDTNKEFYNGGSRGIFTGGAYSNAGGSFVPQLDYKAIALSNGADAGQGANGAGGAGNQQAEPADKGAQGNTEYPVQVDGVHRATPPSFSDYLKTGADATNDPVARLAEGALTSGAELYTAVLGSFGGDGINPYTGDHMNRDERSTAVAQNIFFSLIGLGGRGSAIANQLPTSRAPASVEELLAMMNKRQNVNADFASGDMLAYLRKNEASGSHMLLEGGMSHISLRQEVATRWDAFHEWMHKSLQQRAGGPRPGEDQFIESFLDRHQKLLEIEKPPQ
jgi:hypothetical protein